MPRFAILCAVLPMLGGCPQRAYDFDAPEIQARYAHKYFDGECTSWLRSQRTGYLYCASPAVEVDVPVYMGPAKLEEDVPEPTETDLDSLVAYGEQIYEQNCVACHQKDGQGTPGAFPPLVGAGDYYGDAQNHARIIVHGLNGEIVVRGVTYNGVMAPWGQLSNYAIAAVATYERNSWGNEDGIVLPEDVEAVR